MVLILSPQKARPSSSLVIMAHRVHTIPARCVDELAELKMSGASTLVSREEDAVEVDQYAVIHACDQWAEGAPAGMQASMIGRCIYDPTPPPPISFESTR